MKLVKINAQNYVNPEHVVSVAFMPDKLMTLVICPDKLMLQSDFTFEQTVIMLTGETD